MTEGYCISWCSWCQTTTSSEVAIPFLGQHSHCRWALFTDTCPDEMWELPQVSDMLFTVLALTINACHPRGSQSCLWIHPRGHRKAYLRPTSCKAQCLLKLDLLSSGMTEGKLSHTLGCQKIPVPLWSIAYCLSPMRLSPNFQLLLDRELHLT